MLVTINDETMNAYKTNGQNGGRRYYVQKDGIYKTTFDGFKVGQSQRSGNATVKLFFTVVDKDEEGLKVNMTLPVSGTDVKGRPNAYRILGFFSAWGVDIDGMKNKEFDLEAKLQELENKEGYVSIKNELYARQKDGLMAASAKAVGFWKAADVEDLKKSKPDMIRHASKADLSAIGKPAVSYVDNSTPF